MNTVSEAVNGSRAAIESEPQRPTIDLNSGATDGAAPVDGAANLGAAPSVGPDPAMVPMLAIVANAPFNYLAKRTEFDGFRLSEKEVGDLVPAINRCLEHYMPTLPALVAENPAVGLVAAVATLAGVKAMAYMQFKAEREEARLEAEKAKAEAVGTQLGDARHE